MPPFDTPVLIAGAGPAGLVTSLLLSDYGVPHVLLEKYEGMAHIPRAHLVNQRTCEIFRELGLEEAFLELAMDWDLIGNNSWSTSLASGTEIARVHAWGTSPERRADYIKASPCPVSNC